MQIVLNTVMHGDISYKIKDLVKFESGELKVLEFDSIYKSIDTVGNIDLRSYRRTLEEKIKQCRFLSIKRGSFLGKINNII